MMPKRFTALLSAPEAKSTDSIAIPRSPPICSNPAPRRDTRCATRSAAISASPSMSKNEPRAGEQAALAFDKDEQQGLCREAVAIRAVAPVVEEQLRSQGTWELATNLEFPLITVLARMEHTGILVDRDYLEKLNAEFGEKMTSPRAHYPGACGRGVQRELQSATAAHPLRKARSCRKRARSKPAIRPMPRSWRSSREAIRSSLRCSNIARYRSSRTVLRKCCWR